MELLTQPDGEFKGWSYWPGEYFEHKAAGPFYFRKINDEYVSRFRATEKHLNGGGMVHGGCMMTFADFALFVIAHDEMQGGYGVTVAFNCEFIQGPKAGELMEAKGEVLRAGGSLVFVRGLITGNGQTCLNFSGTIKKIRPRK